MAFDKNDKLTDIKTVLDESTSTYYSDVFTPGETKEQLQIGQEVAGIKEISGEIDTSLTYTTLSNTYTLDVPSFAGNKIFSIGIDGNNKTFQPTDYASLETELQDWLGVNYLVTYTSGTEFTINRLDGTVITKTEPDLVRKLDLTTFDTVSALEIVIDGETILLDGVVHGGDAYAAWVYFISQLTGGVYYRVIEGNSLIIARIDNAIPAITVNTINRYIYNVNGWDTPGYNYNPTSTNVGGSGTTSIKTDWQQFTIDGTPYKYITPVTKDYASYSFSYTYVNFTPTNSGTISNGENYAGYFVDWLYSQLSGYTRTSPVTSPDTGVQQNRFSFSFYLSDYSILTNSYEENFFRRLDEFNNFDSVTKTFLNTNYPGLLPNFFGYSQTIKTAGLTIAVYTEITITLTNDGGFYYYIPVTLKNIKQIKMSATSSIGTSEGIRTVTGQSCTTKYSTTTTFVDDKIFKTGASDFGNIVQVKNGGFIIDWDVTVSNKLNYICS